MAQNLRLDPLLKLLKRSDHVARRHGDPHGDLSLQDDVEIVSNIAIIDQVSVILVRLVVQLLRHLLQLIWLHLELPEEASVLEIVRQHAQLSLVTVVGFLL